MREGFTLLESLVTIAIIAGDRRRSAAQTTIMSSPAESIGGIVAAIRECRDKREAIHQTQSNAESTEPEVSRMTLAFQREIQLRETEEC